MVTVLSRDTGGPGIHLSRIPPHRCPENVHLFLNRLGLGLHTVSVPRRGAYHKGRHQGPRPPELSTPLSRRVSVGATAANKTHHSAKTHCRDESGAKGERTTFGRPKPEAGYAIESLDIL